MRAEKGVLKTLNHCLAGELMAIHQYILHARMFKAWGITHLADHEYQSAIEEMKHADLLIERILFLDGIPNMQDIGKLRIGKDVQNMLKNDLALEKDGIPVLRQGVAHCEQVGDFISRDLLRNILADEEEHYDWLETQLQLMERMGLQNYIQQQSTGGE